MKTSQIITNLESDAISNGSIRLDVVTNCTRAGDYVRVTTLKSGAPYVKMPVGVPMRMCCPGSVTRLNAGDSLTPVRYLVEESTEGWTLPTLLHRFGI